MTDQAPTPAAYPEAPQMVQGILIPDRRAKRTSAELIVGSIVAVFAIGAVTTMGVTGRLGAAEFLTGLGFVLTHSAGITIVRRNGH